MFATRTLITSVVTTAAALTLGGAAAAQSTSPSTSQSTRVAVKAARLIDGTGAPLINNGVVLIEGDRITAAGAASSITIPAGTRVIDLGNSTLLPGFIDTHTHIIGRDLSDPASDHADLTDYRGYPVIVGVDNARKTLLAGFTTIRNLGASGFDDIALRTAINDGVVPGPRMQSAGHSIGITGGHCDTNGYRPGVADGDYRTGQADGPEEARKAVRYQVKYGADAIKICQTGGVLSEGDAVGATQFTLEETRAIVNEANKLERKVAAHAHGAEGIRIAAEAGVASIEHGSFLDEEGARLMAQKGTVLVPTLSAGEVVEIAAKSGRLKGLRAEKALAAAAAMRNTVHIAQRFNIPVVFGTDAGVGKHGENAREFTLLVEWGGMTPMAALLTSASNAAKLLGWEDDVGTLAKGRYADIVAVPGNPLDDIKVTERPVFVMKGGVVYKSPDSSTAGR